MYADDTTLLYAGLVPGMFDVDKCLTRMETGIHRENVSEIVGRYGVGNTLGQPVGRGSSGKPPRMTVHRTFVASLHLFRVLNQGIIRDVFLFLFLT